MKTLNVFTYEYTIPSDGRFWLDLINLIDWNEEKNQTEKEILKERKRTIDN